jgi:hypothetical protein
VKFKKGDIVWYDDNRGVIVCGYPGNNHAGYSYDIRWDDGPITGDVWESDLCANDCECREEE